LTQHSHQRPAVSQYATAIDQNTFHKRDELSRVRRIGNYGVYAETRRESTQHIPAIPQIKLNAFG
jgi:hypothetical protein